MEETAEAPPVADEARRFRGSVPIGGREQRTGIGRHDGEQMVLADKKKETAKAVSFW